MLLDAQTSRALLVEDNPADARLVEELLAEHPDGFALTVANRLSAALDLLAEEQFAVVLVDLGLPDAARTQALDALRGRVGSTPVVVYSGGADDTLAAEARALGVSDVLRKGALDGEALTATLRAIVDGAAFCDAVRERLRRAKSSGEDVAVVRLVVERAVLPGGASAEREGTLAHLVAERMGGRLAADDGLFDLGEGRYGVVATVTGGASGAAALSADLCRAFDRPLLVGRHAVALTVRAGQASALGGAGTADVLLAHASAALREAAAVDPVPAAPLREGGADGTSFASRLRHAIRSGEMVLHYQPIVGLADDGVPLVEALVRWNDPVRGVLNPGAFIPLAEETSLIEEIGTWALEEACRQLRAWDDAGLPPVRCAVNLSARELSSTALPARVADALAAAGVPADRLELELTESMFADPQTTARVIARLRAIGVRIAIDDFGTGYSSLAYLSRFAVDTVKVDGAFVRRAAEEADAAAVVTAIVQIAHQLGLQVVAEGVETPEQLAFVRAQGCDLVQGWLFSAARPGTDAAAWLQWAAAQRAPAEAAAPQRGWFDGVRALRRGSAGPAPAPRATRLLAADYAAAQDAGATAAGG